MFLICWSQKYKHIHIFSVKFNPSVFRTYVLTVKPSLMYDPNMLTVLENNQIYIFLCSAHKTRYKSIFSLSLCYVTQKSVIFNVSLTVKQKFTSFAFCTWNYVLIERNQSKHFKVLLGPTKSGKNAKDVLPKNCKIHNLCIGWVPSKRNSGTLVETTTLQFRTHIHGLIA